MMSVIEERVAILQRFSEEQTERIQMTVCQTEEVARAKFMPGGIHRELYRTDGLYICLEAESGAIWEAILPKIAAIIRPLKSRLEAASA